MAQVEVEVEKSKSNLVTRYKERIELLFDVVVSVKIPPVKRGFEADGIQGGNTTFALRLSSSTSQESLEKAINVLQHIHSVCDISFRRKVFLKAALEESPDFTTVHHSFPHEVFEMVLKNSQAIERHSLAVLDFDLNTLQLTIKGHPAGVKTAGQQIQKLIMGQGDMDPAIRRHGINIHGQTYLQGPSVSSGSVLGDRDSGLLLQDKHCDPLSSSLRDVDNNLILEQDHADSMRSYSLTMDAEVDFPSISSSEPELIERGFAPSKNVTLARTFAQVVSPKEPESVKEVESENDNADTEMENKFKQMMSDHSSTASSEEDSGVSVVDKSDSRYESRLEFSVKLGYTESDLDKVINRRGLDCDLNTLLQELIENSKGVNSPESEDVESIGPTLAAPDIASSEVFLGVMQKVSKSEDSSTNLRHIVIDGSNVAMSHGKNVFSCRGIKIAVDWFKQRGHTEITVFVPQWRKEASRPDTPITDQELLIELEKEGIVVFTPARRIKGRRMVCYDDRFVLKLAADTDGIVVSNDNYRDLLNENQEYRTVVDERLLMYTFVNDRFMPPEDPLGRRGPTLDNFLCKEPTSPPTLPPECPYGRKCTYGSKCKYHHPERGSQPHKTVTQVLKEQATRKMQERAVKGPEAFDKSRRSKPKLTRTRSLMPGEALPADKNSLLLPSDLQEPDVDAGRLKSPTRASSTLGKTADYLREHRKKLEEALAIASATKAQESTAAKTSEAANVSRPQEALSPLPALGSRVSSPSHLNVPFSASQDSQLVSGHLLLAKKLSDEASESSFFSNESSSNRASPVALAGPANPGIGRQESAPYNLEKFHNRRSSLQDHHQSQHQNQQYYPSRMFPREVDSTSGKCVSGPPHLPSHRLSGFAHDPAFSTVPAFGAQCQSYPTSEKEAAHGGLRRVTGYYDPPPAMSTAGSMVMEPGHREHVPLKSQYSCPPGQYLQNPGQFPGRPIRGMMRQNSSSDPQLHISGSSESSLTPWQPSPVQHPPMPTLDSHGGRPMYYSSDHRAGGEVQQRHPQNLYRSTSMQPFHAPQSFGPRPGLERQYSEVLFESQDQSAPSSPYLPQWEIHSHPSTPTHHHSPGMLGMGQNPGHHSPGMLGMGQNPGMSLWQQSPVHRTVPAAGKCSQPVQPSFPASQPIPTTDLRYPLYYHLCGIFAEHRVRAVMNKFPEEKDPQKLCASIVSGL